jgi:hypothetical protein
MAYFARNIEASFSEKVAPAEVSDKVVEWYERFLDGKFRRESTGANLPTGIDEQALRRAFLDGMRHYIDDLDFNAGCAVWRSNFPIFTTDYGPENALRAIYESVCLRHNITDPYGWGLKINFPVKWLVSWDRDSDVLSIS